MWIHPECEARSDIGTVLVLNAPAARRWRVPPPATPLIFPRLTTTRLRQGLTLVRFPAKRKRFLWDRGCIWGLLMGCLFGMC
jgi:hypothetical protein